MSSMIIANRAAVSKSRPQPKVNRNQSSEWLTLVTGEAHLQTRNKVSSSNNSSNIIWESHMNKTTITLLFFNSWRGLINKTLIMSAQEVEVGSRSLLGQTSQEASFIPSPEVNHLPSRTQWQLSRRPPCIRVGRMSWWTISASIRSLMEMGLQTCRISRIQILLWTTTLRIRCPWMPLWLKMRTRHWQIVRELPRMSLGCHSTTVNRAQSPLVSPKEGS
jgi:hypothetical protein